MLSSSAGPIGVFDSGYGGLTILNSIRQQLPQYDYLYLGDNARAPYGPRSFDVVYEFTRQAVLRLFEMGCHLVILGCNTASAKALRTIQQHDLPQWDPERRVLGVIRPTAEVIGELTKSRHVGVLATEGTIKSESYNLEIQKLHPDVKVSGVACPFWVPLVEYNEADSPGADYFVKKRIDQIMAKDPEIDAIIDNTIQMVERCIRQFAKRMKFASPLTPGGDSRLNCAFLNKLIPQDEVLYYVIRTTEMKSFQENEILVRKLADEFGFHDFHFYQETETLTDERVAAIKRVFGPIREWPKKIWAYHPELKDRTIVSGALIGHILGGELGKNMPEWLVGLWFMKIRQRNVSKLAGKAVAEWYRDAMSAVKKGYSKFDMWYWEIRCGRWNANTISRDDIIGIHDINIYNSHRIINEWCKIPKRLRVRKLIHKRMLMRLCPSVADVTFNPCAHRGSRMRLPILAKIIPPWCRWIVVHFMEMWRRGR